MMRRLLCLASILAFGSLALANSGQAPQQQNQGWRFGAGTRLNSFSLDGDLGFPTMGGGVISDVDLSNSETRDLAKSGYGGAGFAAKGKWTILAVFANTTMEDSSNGIDTDWDRQRIELEAARQFASKGNHTFGALVGVRSINHDWNISTAGENISVDERFVDGVLGVTHALRFAKRWTWTNRIDAGVGESESAYSVSSGLGRLFGRRWLIGATLNSRSFEFGERSDIADTDFYLYDIRELSGTFGFLFLW